MKRHVLPLAFYFYMPVCPPLLLAQQTAVEFFETVSPKANRVILPALSRPSAWPSPSTPNSASYYNRGLAKANLKDHRGAILDYDKAIELNGKDALAYLSRGVSKSRQEDHRGALLDFSRSIELNPDDPQAYYNRGVSRSRMDQYRGALADFSKAIELEPANAQAYYTRAVTKQKLDDYAGSVPISRK